MTRFFHRLKVLFNILVVRKVPHGILSWRYILPNQPTHIKLHRTAFLNSIPQLPRVIWWLIAPFHYGRWFLIYGPWFAIRCWKRHAQNIEQREGIARFKQLRQIMSLSLCNAVLPFDYYYYRLYRFPKKRWLEFIYDQELPSWHLMHSQTMSKVTQLRINNKAVFADYLTLFGMPVIPTVLLERGKELTEQAILSKKSLFFKPCSGSRKQGCYMLNFSRSDNTYCLQSDAIEIRTNQGQILGELQKAVRSKSYIYQPLLVNPENLLLDKDKVPNRKVVKQAKQLVTFRVVTKIENKSAEVTSAIFEWPTDPVKNAALPILIDIDTGELADASQYLMHFEEHDEELKTLAGLIINQWEEIKNAATSAHQHFPDLYTIGWDIAVTDQGLRLIEGNINWVISPHQLIAPKLLNKLYVKGH